jgi:hypothetical protein
MYVKCSIGYKYDGLQLSIYARDSWDMAQTSSTTCHSITHGTGKEYEREEEAVESPVDVTLVKYSLHVYIS